MEHYSVQQFKQEVKATRTLFAAIVGGIVLFLIVALVVHFVKGPFLLTKQYLVLFEIIDIALYAILFFTANHLYQKKIQSIEPLPDNVQERITNYRSALMIFLACVDASAIVSIIFFLLLGNYIFLVFLAIKLIRLFGKAPTAVNIAAGVAITSGEQSYLDT